MIRPSAAIVYLDEHREPRHAVVHLAGRVRTLLVSTSGVRSSDDQQSLTAAACSCPITSVGPTSAVCDT